MSLAAVLAVQLARVANRAYLLVLVVIAGLLAGEALFLTGRPAAGILAALYALMLLYALAGGVFTPVFTGNHLRATGRGDQAPFVRPLETAAVVSIVALAVADLAGAPAPWRAALALAASAVHAVRLARWRGWTVLDQPLLWTMHAGYAWMTASFLLQALGDGRGGCAGHDRCVPGNVARPQHNTKRARLSMLPAANFLRVPRSHVAACGTKLHAQSH